MERPDPNNPEAQIVQIVITASDTGWNVICMNRTAVVDRQHFESYTDLEDHIDFVTDYLVPA